MSYDPTEYSSLEEAARSQAAMEDEFGRPRDPRPTSDPLERRVRELHFETDKRIRDEWGWCGKTEADLRRKLGLDN